MEINIHNQMFLTSDKLIRAALRNILDKELEKCRNSGHKAEIFEELGVRHGTARIDYAIINGMMSGYEIKSDRDTLERLPKQVKEFSAVFDKLTLVIGKRHLYHAIYIIPDWWGVMIAKVNTDNKVFFQTIRKAGNNQNQVGVSIARLLWREEALRILEERNEAEGVRFKPREFIYKRLADVLDTNTLKEQVISQLISREGWRSDLPLALSGG